GGNIPLVASWLVRAVNIDTSLGAELNLRQRGSSRGCGGGNYCGDRGNENASGNGTVLQWSFLL
ncbi:hypothetical protein HDU76_011129, partial [Blyttiomyces sp. JEL0837]